MNEKYVKEVVANYADLKEKALEKVIAYDKAQFDIRKEVYAYKAEYKTKYIDIESIEDGDINYSYYECCQTDYSAAPISILYEEEAKWKEDLRTFIVGVKTAEDEKQKQKQIDADFFDRLTYERLKKKFESEKGV